MIRSSISESIRVKQALLDDAAVVERISAAAALMTDCIRSGHKIMWAGNGGSAADAQHLAAELVNKFRLERKGMASIALTTDTSILTSIGNDYGYDRVFARQVEALGRKGDILVGISTSGNSRNLIEAYEACREAGVASIAMTGESDCRMDCYDLVIKIPSKETPRIQECQTLVGHILCEMIEKEIYG